MIKPPPEPKIYHITHVANLPQIISDGRLISDAEMIRRGGPLQAIGMSDIKRRRVEKIEIACHPGSMVGDYVPFYFCPRSIMLYLIHRANHPQLTYRGGQGSIVHLEGDLNGVIRWAEAQRALWAFALGNAGAFHTEFRTGATNLEALDWSAIAATDFRDPDVKEGKQAEFLVHHFFPWHLVDRIGVLSERIRDTVLAAIAAAAHRPRVEIRPEWYY